MDQLSLIVPVLMFGSGPKRNLDHRSISSALIGMLMSSSKLSLFSSERSSKETVIGIVLCHSHQACCLLQIYQFAFYTSVSGCGCGFGFEQKFRQIDGFSEKRHGSADLQAPIHPL